MAAVPGTCRRAVKELLDRKLWEAHDIGYRVHDYLDWNDSREVVMKKREGAHRRLFEHRERNALPPEAMKRVSLPTSETLLARSGVVKSGSFPEKGSGEKPITRTPESSLEPDDIAERAGQLLERYRELYAQHRHGARLRLIGNSLEFQDACGLVKNWPDDRLEKLAVLVLTTDDEWISRTDRGFKIFALKASWADDKLRAWEKETGVAV